jgi:hypothetical protein
MPSPKLIGSYKNHNYVSVEVAENTAYLNGYHQLYVLDISDPTQPILKGEYQSSINLNGSIETLAIQEKTAYLIDENSRIEIVDFSDPEKPIVKGEYQPDKSKSFVVLPWMEAVIEGNYLYIPSGPGGLQIVDISKPSSPKLISNYIPLQNKVDFWVSEVTISGSYAYISSNSGIEILDINNPDKPILKGTYNRPREYINFYSSDSIAVSGNYAYLVNDELGLQILDVSDPSKPILKGTYAIKIPEIRPEEGSFSSNFTSTINVEIVGDYAYIVDNYRLQIVDVSNPEKPNLKAFHELKSPSFVFDLQIAGNYAFFLSESSGLQIIQLTDNTPPSAVDRVITLEANTSYTFAAADFQFTDSDLDNTLKTVQITGLTSQGELFLDANGNKQNDGESVPLNREIAIADLPQLTFKPQRDQSGLTYDTFQFKVSDGIAYSSQAYTISFNVNPIKKEPELPPEPEKEFTEIELTPTYLPDGVDPNFNPCLLIYNPPAIPSPNLTTDTRTVPAFTTPEGYAIFFGDESYNTIDAGTVPLAAIIGDAGNDNIFGSSTVGVGNHDGDVLGGNKGADYIDAKAGHDIVFGGQDNDVIRGNDGDDALLGDLGNDLILGDAGNDGLSGMEGIDYLNGGSGDDFLSGGDDNDAAVGGDGNDRLFGDAGNDCMSGQIGDDLLFGGTGVDLLNGDSGNDTLYGGKDSDTLVAGAGNDLLLSDLGNDILIGGTGGDRFDFLPGDGFDVIADFQDGTDIIGLRGFNFGEVTIKEFGSDTLITATGLTVILQRVSVTAIDASDFARL